MEVKELRSLASSGALTTGCWSSTHVGVVAMREARSVNNYTLDGTLLALQTSLHAADEQTNDADVVVLRHHLAGPRAGGGRALLSS